LEEQRLPIPGAPGIGTVAHGMGRA
jgi:hypothetical protein